MSAQYPDPDDYRPRPLMGRAFWLLLVFAFVCVVAGAGVAMLAPRLFPPQAAPSGGVALSTGSPVLAAHA